jgi:hypothetical protein
VIVGRAGTLVLADCATALHVRLHGFEEAPGRLRPKEFERYAVVDNDTIYGDLKSLGPVIRMSETSPHWSRTTPRLGSSRPEWAPR